MDQFTQGVSLNSCSKIEPFHWCSAAKTPKKSTSGDYASTQDIN